MRQESGLFEGDYCFLLPAGGIPDYPRVKQEEKMKSRSEPSIKTRNTSPAKQLRQEGKTDASSGNYDCPREQMIAEAAYYRAEQRGFTPGNEMSDWLDAEADVEGVLHNPG